MKATMAKRSFTFLKVFIFEELLIFNALQKYIANITFKQFSKCCLILWFYNLLENGRKKSEIIPFWGKKAEEKQNSATTIPVISSQTVIYADRKGTVFPVKLKLQMNHLIKDIKKRVIKKN